MNEAYDGEPEAEGVSGRKAAFVSEELTRILDIVRENAPCDAKVSIEFDGRLHLHVDVRHGEEIEVLKKVLPMIGKGIFHTIEVGATPHHPFFHRISALVDK